MKTELNEKLPHTIQALSSSNQRNMAPRKRNESPAGSESLPQWGSRRDPAG